MSEEVAEKKVFENTDFKFIAAYGAYSGRFEQSENNDEERQRLNDLIVKLDANEISYPNFYEEVSRPDREEGERRYKFQRRNRNLTESNVTRDRRSIVNA